MGATSDAKLLRPMSAADIADVLDVQGPGAVCALAAVFPQEAYPFPRVEVSRRWQREVADP